MADGSHGTVLVKKSSRSWGEVVSHSNEVNTLLFLLIKDIKEKILGDPLPTYG
jgi:hypothetical protein